MDGELQALHPVWPNGHGKMIKAISEHGNMVKACRDIGITRTSVYRWINDDPEYKAAFDAAREIGERRMFDDAQDHVYSAIAPEAPVTPHSLQTARWVMASLKPSVYSERSRTELTGKDGAPLLSGITVTFVDPK